MQNKGIIGAVCGDIIGSAYEFHKTKDYWFKLFTPQSKFTDDTVMTCAVAEWLMDDPKHSHKKLVEIMHRYGEEYPHRGYGGMFKQWLENKWTEPYNSFGNGSAMRVSPVGYYAKSLEEALQLAQISAEVTHNHPEGIIGAQAVAATIFLLNARFLYCTRTTSIFLLPVVLTETGKLAEACLTSLSDERDSME